MINNEKKEMINFSITFFSREQNLSLTQSIRAEISKQKETRGEQSEKSFMRGNSWDSWNKISFLVIQSCGHDQ